MMGPGVLRSVCVPGLAAVLTWLTSCGGDRPRAVEPAAGPAASAGPAPDPAPTSADESTPGAGSEVAPAADESAPGTFSTPARAAAEFEAVAGSACACTDLRCAEGVFAEFKLLVKKYRDTKADEEATRRTERAVQQLVDCLVDLGISRESLWESVERS